MDTLYTGFTPPFTSAPYVYVHPVVGICTFATYEAVNEFADEVLDAFDTHESTCSPFDYPVIRARAYIIHTAASFDARYCADANNWGVQS